MNEEIHQNALAQFKRKLFFNRSKSTIDQYTSKVTTTMKYLHINVNHFKEKYQPTDLVY